MSELPTRVRQGYGLGALGISLCNTAVLLFLTKFLVDEAGIEPLWAGALVFAGKVWDAFTDPYVGRLSDRTRSHRGPRRPWLLYGVWPFALFAACLWQPVPFEGWAKITAYGLLLILYNTALTTVVVPYGALTPVIAQTYDQRTQLNAARMGWSIVGGIVAAIVVPMLRQQTGTYSTGTMVLAVAAILPVLAAYFATKGRDHPLPEGTEARGDQVSVMRVTPFLKVAILFVAAWGSLSIVAAILPFYIEHYVGRPDLEDLFFGANQITGLLSVPLVAWVARNTQKHTAYALFMGSWAVLFTLLALIPRGSWEITLLMLILAGPGLAAAHILPWAMLPDVVDVDRATHGQGRAGAFYGAMTFIEKLGTAAALQSAMLAVSFGGYVPKAAVQSDVAVETLALVIGPMPAVVLMVATAIALFAPPVTREQLEEARSSVSSPSSSPSSL